MSGLPPPALQAGQSFSQATAQLLGPSANPEESPMALYPGTESVATTWYRVSNLKIVAIAKVEVYVMHQHCVMIEYVA